MGKNLTQKAKKATRKKINIKRGYEIHNATNKKFDRQFPLKAKTKIKMSGTNEREYSKNLPLKSYDKKFNLPTFLKRSAMMME